MFLSYQEFLHRIIAYAILCVVAIVIMLLPDKDKKSDEE